VEPESHVDRVGDVVVITHKGAIDFDEAHNAIGIGLTSAKKAAGKKLLFDLRFADLSNYYSFIVRHAELAPGMGLDASFLVAFVGTREAADVLSFTERVVEIAAAKTPAPGTQPFGSEASFPAVAQSDFLMS
jgi:hypothetical protein